MTRLELILSCLTICLLVGLVMSVSLNTYYLARISDLEETLLAYESELALYTVSIDFLFDYGNGTRAWVNETRFPAWTSLLNATMAIADVETRPPYPGHPGIAVKGINGVLENPEQLMYWMWWYWDVELGEWVLGPKMPSDYLFDPGEHVICWYYQKVEAWPPPPPA